MVLNNGIEDYSIPLPYVRQLSKKHNRSTRAGEAKWAEAKAAAEKQGHGDDYGYITAIFKKMMHEATDPLFPLLSELNNQSE